MVMLSEFREKSLTKGLPCVAAHTEKGFMISES